MILGEAGDTAGTQVASEALMATAPKFTTAAEDAAALEQTLGFQDWPQNQSSPLAGNMQQAVDASGEVAQLGSGAQAACSDPREAACLLMDDTEFLDEVLRDLQEPFLDHGGNDATILNSEEAVLSGGRTSTGFTYTTGSVEAARPSDHCQVHEVSGDEAPSAPHPGVDGLACSELSYFGPSIQWCCQHQDSSCVAGIHSAQQQQPDAPTPAGSSPLGPDSGCNLAMWDVTKPGATEKLRQESHSQGLSNAGHCENEEQTMPVAEEHDHARSRARKFTPPLVSGTLGGSQASSQDCSVIDIHSSSSSELLEATDSDLSVVDSQPTAWGEEGHNSKRRKALLHPNALPGQATNQGSASRQSFSGNGWSVGEDEDVIVVLSRDRSHRPGHKEKRQGQGDNGATSSFTSASAQGRQMHASKSAQQGAGLDRMQQQHQLLASSVSAHLEQGVAALARPPPGPNTHRVPFRSPGAPGPGASNDRSLVVVPRPGAAQPQPEPGQLTTIKEGVRISETNKEVEMEEGLLSVQLLRHQKLALGWMEQREQSIPAGGILGDDQGLGKTVSTIALIVRCHYRRKKQEVEQQRLLLGTGNSSEQGNTEEVPETGAAVVACASSAAEFALTGVRKCGKVEAEVVNLDDDDVASSSGLQKCQPVGREAVRTGLMGSSTSPGKLFQVKSENIDAASQQNSNSASQSKRLPGGTLVVCPTSVLWQWEKELRAKLGPLVNRDIKVLVYHGVNRSKKTAEELASYGVVLTTYAIVALDVPRAEGGRGVEEKEKRDAWGIPSGGGRRGGIKGPWAALLPEAQQKQKQRQAAEGKAKRGAAAEGARGPLARIAWHRVVLDEAQCIKNRTTQMAHSCWGLRAKRRWCLSGTPIQNAVDDVYSYFRFLRLHPYDDYASFRSEIKDSSQGMQRLQALLKAVMLRRTKTMKLDGQPIIQLPRRIVRLCQIEFSPAEWKMYTHLEVSSKAQFQDFARSGSLKKNYMSILVMVLRLRQLCNHPQLLNKDRRSGAGSAQSGQGGAGAHRLPVAQALQLLSCWNSGAGLCGVCRDVAAEAPALTKCGHTFCYQCIMQHIEDSDVPTCPSCFHPVHSAAVYTVTELEAFAGEGQGVHDDGTLASLEGQLLGTSTLPGSEQLASLGTEPSSKVKELLKLLLALPEVPHKSIGAPALTSGPMLSLNPGKEAEVEAGAVPRKYREKAIVFSQWSSMLDLVEEPLRQAGLVFVRLDGSMSCAERDQAVTRFITHPEITVILMSLKAASLGLNLVVARHVVLLDLWWNPATEEQAIDRAHRIGQTRPVEVSRFAVKGTIEDRILELQERKRNIVASAFGESQDGSNALKLTMQDLAFLFSSG